MKFFIPNTTDEAVQSQLDHMIGRGIRPVFSYTYVHDGDKIEVEVGMRRVVYSPLRGPRGGRIKNAELSRGGVAQGNVVDLIMETSGELQTLSKQTTEWGPWSYVPIESVVPGTLVYFDLTDTARQ